MHRIMNRHHDCVHHLEMWGVAYVSLVPTGTDTPGVVKMRAKIAGYNKELQII